MDIFHPFNGRRKATTVPAEVAAIVAGLPALPQVELPSYTKAYWVDMGLGVVPAGRYSNPDTVAAERAVEALYAGLKGAKITRHRVAIALGFRSADDVDAIRKRLHAGKVDIYRGRPGVSVHHEGARKAPKAKRDVIADQAAKRAAEAVAAEAQVTA